MTTKTTSAQPEQQQQSAGYRTTLPNFHHLSSHNPAAIEAYLHLYVDSLAKAEFGTSGSGNR